MAVAKLTGAGERMLRKAVETGGTFCGYSRYAMRTAWQLTQSGYGEVHQTDLGPALFITKAGLKALAEVRAGK